MLGLTWIHSLCSAAPRRHPLAMRRAPALVSPVVAIVAGALAAQPSLAETATVATSRIPLVPGLVVTYVVTRPDGDREPLLTVTAVRPDGFDALLSEEVDAPGGGRRTIQVLRTVRAQDAASARVIRTVFFERDRALFPGTTPFLSAAIMEGLRRGSAALTSIELDSDAGIAIERRRRGTLQRVGKESLTLLVNGKPTGVGVLRARGPFADLNGDDEQIEEMLALDDPANPIFLRWSSSTGRSRVIRIDYPVPPAVAEGTLDAALAKREPVAVYSIYFAFASAALRAQSKPTLEQIATVLRKHPDWRIGIEGHTDSIGRDAANLELSRLRAEAVRTALTRDYGIAVDRIKASGAGESGAIDTNDTPEGRARNRRVVLSRI
jgi:outer membrane protein OmpA-like peptidoglycan-associated protein